MDGMGIMYHNDDDETMAVSKVTVLTGSNHNILGTGVG